jgi:hypothetical protein
MVVMLVAVADVGSCVCVCVAELRPRLLLVRGGGGRVGVGLHQPLDRAEAGKSGRSPALPSTQLKWLFLAVPACLAAHTWVLWKVWD